MSDRVSAVLLLLSLLWIDAADAQRAQPDPPAWSLSVREGQLTANINRIPLHLVLKELARQVPLRLALSEDSRGHPVTAHFRALALDDALARLLAGFSYAIIHEAPAPNVRLHTPSWIRTSPCARGRRRWWSASGRRRLTRRRSEALARMGGGAIPIGGHFHLHGRKAMRNLMSDLWKSALVLCVISMGLGMSAPAQAASANGPYYAVPSWDQKLPADTRFIVLSNWNNEAVLDRETGLVWERSPDTAARTWFDASFHCMNLNSGGRTGWRLPTVQELLSLVDRSMSSPALPSGHPFTNVQLSFFFYWSATTRVNDATVAWDVSFVNGGVFRGAKSAGVSDLAWCVRGGQGVDPQ